jgi:sulfite oxidase
LETDIPLDKKSLEIVCVATDSDQNTQPETPKSIWNARGLMNNSWHKIKIEFE